MQHGVTHFVIGLLWYDRRYGKSFGQYVVKIVLKIGNKNRRELIKHPQPFLGC